MTRSVSGEANPNLGYYPPLLAAIAQEGHDWTVIDLSLRAGADPDFVDEDGKNLLHRAARHTADPEFIVRCGAAVSDINHADRLGDRAIDSIFDESWDPTDTDDATELLAFVALRADLTSVGDRLPDWLDLSGPSVRVHANSQFESKLAELQGLATQLRLDYRDK